MIYFLIITALTVSIDSFVCGFSLAFANKRKFPVVLIIALTVFLMCLFTNYAPFFFENFLNEKASFLGGIVLIIVGTINLIKSLKSIKQNPDKKLLISSKIFLVGFAVGIDGALANLSLSLMGLNGFFVPITIAITHALMVYLGIVLSGTPLTKKFGKIEFLPPLVLIVLGGYKLLGLFI